MSRAPYPSHNPHHGRPFIVVHNHDVLCGRGVNIAQHPGNERFRALVSTIHDDSYCTNYTTSEKRALAEEIIKHISSLNPRGRFLKRGGRSQSSRGLNGPWEELSERECIKKTCQALRDCNRMDRQGYAAQVAVPTDVRESADKRSASGLSLKEHAAAAVARANPCRSHPNQLGLDDPSHGIPSDPMSASTASKRSRSEFSPDSFGSGSPAVDNATNAILKKPRHDESPLGGLPMHADAIFASLDVPTSSATAATIATTSSAPSLAATSASSANSTPATVSHQPYQLIHPHQNPIFSSISVPHLGSPAAPIPSPAPVFHQDSRVVPAQSMVAPCSPVGLFSTSLPEVSSSETGLADPSPPDIGLAEPLSRPIYHHPPHAHYHHHLHHHDISHTHQLDAVQTAADMAAALASSPTPGISFPLLSPEDVQHGSLGIDDI